MRYLLLIAIAIAIALFLYVPSKSQPQIPAAFHGVWDENDTACKEKYSTMRLQIGTSGVKYWESSAKLISIVKSEDTSFAALYGFSGEGENWESTIAYALSDEGNLLVQYSDDGFSVDRVRCIDI